MAQQQLSPNSSGSSSNPSAQAVAKKIKQADMERRLQSLPTRRRLVGTYCCSLCVCVLPANIAGLVLLYLYSSSADTYCTVPINIWILAWSLLAIFSALLAAPYHLNPHSRTAMYNVVLTLFVGFCQIGMLVWGAIFFFTPGQLTDQCKTNISLLWYIMLIELIVGFLGVLFFFSTVRSTLYSYRLYKLKEDWELEQYIEEQRALQMQEVEMGSFGDGQGTHAYTGQVASPPPGFQRQPSPSPTAPSRPYTTSPSYEASPYGTPMSSYAGHPSAAHSPMTASPMPYGDPHTPGSPYLSRAPRQQYESPTSGMYPDIDGSSPPYNPDFYSSASSYPSGSYPRNYH